MEVAGRPDVMIDLSSAGKGCWMMYGGVARMFVRNLISYNTVLVATIEALKNQSIIIKEGVEYRLKVKFR